MLKDLLKNKSAAKYVEYGYGQVEPNHLSAQRTAQVYAQLPADASIEKLEQGQFVKYDYANGVVNFTGAGEWMLVYNEIKLYREHQLDCEFAMLKDNYQARVYSPFDYENPGVEYQARFLNGVEADAKGMFGAEDVTAPVDMYELHYNEDPFKKIGAYKERMMPEGTTMVPRVLKTNPGDIFTTNTINEKPENVAKGDVLVVGENGLLVKTAVEASDTFAGSGDMKWQVARVYTMPDGQKGVKIVRIA
jgi:hypothetical protein